MDLHAETWVTPPVLTTRRLSLRPMADASPHELATAINHFDVAKWLTMVPHPYAVSDAEWFIAQNAAGAFRSWAVYENGVLVGCVAADKELGYWYRPSAWGKGFATEAGQAVLGHVFGNPDVHEIASSHFVENQGSKNVLEKLGFEDVGSHVHFSRARGTNVPGRSMQLTRPRWEERQDG
ncbi:MAG: GNAT family protein [Pseudomonadota bacterium]